MESPPQYTREKAESELYLTYEKALSLLESGDLSSGDSVLSCLLSNPLLSSLNDIDFKYSILLSQAHAKEALNQIDDSISLYYKANKLHNHIDSGLWLKLALLCEKQAYFAQADLCYQECLRNSRSVAFEKVLYEKMVRMSFLTYDWETVLKRIDFLNKNQPISEEILAIKLFIYMKKGPENLLENTKSEALSRNPKFNIEGFEIISRLRELEKREIEENQRKKQEKQKNEEKDNDFVISLEKNTWKNCLELLSFIMKVLLLRIKGRPLKAKHRKSKFKAYLDQIAKLSLAETSVYFKERKENLGKKSKKPETPNFLEENPIETEENSEKLANFDEKAMEIEDQILEIPSEGFENHLRGKSKRLQSIKACDLSLDEFLLSISAKKNLNFAKKLIEFRDLALQGFPNETLDLFSSLFKTFMPNPIEIIEENPIKIEEIKKPLSELKQKEEKALKKASNEDFLHFLSLTKGQKYPSFLHLIHSIINYFITNKLHPPLISTLSNETVVFSPNALLMMPEIRSLIMKLYMQLWAFTIPKFIDLETNLTLFELAFDYYLERKAKAKPQNSEKTEQKLLILRTILSEISHKFLFSNFSNDLGPESQLILKIRAYHILTIYYTYKDFAAIQMAKSSLKLLRRTLTEYMGKDPANCSEGVDFISLFWLNCKGLNSGFFELIEERMLEEKDSFAKMETEVRQKKLINYLELFQERAVLSFEDALDLYYRQIMEFTLKAGLDKVNFLFSVREILRIFHRVSGSRRSNSEEIRKMLMKTIESMKLESLMIGFIEFLKENDQVLTMEDNKSLMEIAILILKILIEIIAFSSNQESITAREVPLMGFQELAQGFSSILTFFFNKTLINPDYLTISFSFLHFLIDILFQSSQSLHKSVFPLSLRTSFIRQLFSAYEKNPEDRYYDEISQYFNCFYGINSIKGRLESEGPLENESDPLITTITEIAFFIKFISVFNESYFSLNPPRFKYTIQSLLTTAFEFLKHHDDQWILCPRLESLVNENLKNYLETGEASHIEEMFGLRMKNQGGSNCFCEKSCFPKEEELVCLYEKGFFLMGKAFFEQQDQEKVKQRKSNIKKAEKMFQLNVCLNPRDPMAWLFLGRSYREMAFLYADQAIYSMINYKIDEFQGAGAKVERILVDILKRIEKEKGEELRKMQEIKNNCKEIEVDSEEELTKLKEIRCEAKDTLIILNIIEIMQGKFRWVKGEVQWKEYLELQEKGFEKIENIGVNEENVRGFFLREIYVRRKNLALFGKEFNIGHFRNLFQIRELVSKQLIQDSDEFKDESLLNEIEVEVFISLWKIMKRYAKLLKFLEVLGFERVNKKLESLLKKLKLTDIFDLHIIVQRDCIDFLTSLKTLDGNIVDLSEFIDLEKEIQGGTIDDFNLKLMLNTGELIQAGCEIEIDKLLLKLKGLLSNYEDNPEFEYRNFPLNRWINKFLELLLNKLGRLINKYVKKYRYYKHYVLLCYYSAKIYVFLKKPEDEFNESTGKISNMFNMNMGAGGPVQGSEKYLKIFEELFSIKTFELVEIYKREKDSTLCSLFHRDLLFLFLKLKLLKMKSSLSLEKASDVDKLRILNNKISRVMMKNIDGNDIMNEMLILAYSLTLKDLIIAMKRIIQGEKDNEVNLQKWIDDLIFTVIKQRAVNAFLKEKQPELMRNFEEMVRMAYMFYQRKEGRKEVEEVKEDEEGNKKALYYFVSLHNKKKTKSKKMEEHQQPEKDIAIEINIID